MGTPSFQAGFYQSQSNAPSIDNLLGSGYHIGGSVSAPVYGIPLFVGADFDIMPDEEDDTNYYGTTVSAGLGLSKPGGEVHINWDETYADEALVINLFDEWDKFYGERR